MNNHQRKNAQSNATVGAKFEKTAKRYIEKRLNIILEKAYSLEIGLETRSKKNINMT